MVPDMEKQRPSTEVSDDDDGEADEMPFEVTAGDTLGDKEGTVDGETLGDDDGSMEGS